MINNISNFLDKYLVIFTVIVLDALKLSSKMAVIVRPIIPTAFSISTSSSGGMLWKILTQVIISFKINIYINLSSMFSFQVFAIIDVSTQQQPAVLSGCLSTFRAIEQCWTQILRRWDFVRYYNKRRIEYWNDPRLLNIFRQNVASFIWKHSIPHINPQLFPVNVFRIYLNSS